MKAANWREHQVTRRLRLPWNSDIFGGVLGALDQVRSGQSDQESWAKHWFAFGDKVYVPVNVDIRTSVPVNVEKAAGYNLYKSTVLHESQKEGRCGFPEKSSSESLFISGSQSKVLLHCCLLCYWLCHTTSELWLLRLMSLADFQLFKNTHFKS